MEVDTNCGKENSSAEAEKSTTPTIIENTAAGKTQSSLLPPEPSTLLKKGMVSTEEINEAKPSIQNDSSCGTSNALTNFASTTANSADDVTGASFPIEDSRVGGTVDKNLSANEVVGITNKTDRTIASGGRTTAPFGTSTLAKSTVKSKHSSMENTTGFSKTKVGRTSNLNEEKLLNDNITVKNNTEGSKTNTNSKSLKKEARKKRKTSGTDEAEEKGVTIPKKKKPKRKKEKEDTEKQSGNIEKCKKIRKHTKKASSSSGNSGSRSYADHLHSPPGLSAAQIAVQQQMRKALEEDQYSANGSIVDTDSDDDEHQYMYKGKSVRLDRVHLLQAAKRCAWLDDATNKRLLASSSGKESSGKESTIVDTNDPDIGDEEGILNDDRRNNNSGNSSKKKSSRHKKKGRNQYTIRSNNSSSCSTNISNNKNNNITSFKMDKEPNQVSMKSDEPKNISFSGSSEKGAEMERDEGSIFGQTTGSSNSTWVECDKCKKWRRLRGVVDHSKLPKKWYCSMNRNDPERARCSAPEEEYDAPHTAESAADARARRHLRVWVRRLQCNEQYESRLPTLTRGKKRSVASSSKEPYEWVRCCAPTCGKWRVVLKIMDAKQNVIDRTNDGEWYCVMNTWDEKTASCAAPQENLPVIGCPPWVLQDEN